MGKAERNRTSTKRKILTLAERIEVLKKHDDGAGMSCRKIAEQLDVGKTQIQQIIQGKDKYMEQWKSAGMKSDRKYAKARRTMYGDLNEAVFEWFCAARSKNIPISGRLIQEKALLLSAQLDLDDFMASNGWLESWTRRNNIRLSALSGEAAEVNPTVVDDWKARLADICKGYKMEDIYNADETGLFFRALPTRSMTIKGNECKGGKLAKDRISVLLACSAKGDKLTLLVIGRAAKPRCFIGRADTLPVRYTANKKAWMTTAIFMDWLEKVNNNMKNQGRKILLFLDNCSSHPDVEFSNVKLSFLPANTTSRLQPCDAGIIQAVKLHYRKKLVRHVLFYMDEIATASELVKTVNVLDAIMWVNSAWDVLQPETIEKCFAKCGFNFGDQLHVTTATGKDLSFFFPPDTIFLFSFFILQSFTFRGNIDQHKLKMNSLLCFFYMKVK